MRFGAPELIILLVIVMLVFGVGKLPEVGRSLGKGIREFRKEVKASQSEEPKTAKAEVATPAEHTTASKL